jgi:hypothetical protein
MDFLKIERRRFVFWILKWLENCARNVILELNVNGLMERVCVKSKNTPMSDLHEAQNLWPTRTVPDLQWHEFVRKPYKPFWFRRIMQKIFKKNVGWFTMHLYRIFPSCGNIHEHSS